jgi:hypothetical protein
MKRLCAAVVATLMIGGQPASGAQQRPSNRACDRTCLLEIADAYLAALAARDPKKAPLAPGVRFTEQTQVLAPGEGLWKTASEISKTFKIPVPDPVSGQIGVIVMVREAGAGENGEDRWAELALRLKVENRTITEAEHLIARITNPAQLANLQTPRPGLLADVAPAERHPRWILLLVANSYYDAITQNNGNLAPFAPECGRRENGMHTAGAGAPPAPPGGRGGPPGLPPGPPVARDCAGQLSSRVMSYIRSIDLRRVEIADEQKGLVFALSMFRHPMDENPITVITTDGQRVPRQMNFKPFDLPAAHIFKIRGGRIYEIEAMGFTMPYLSKNGWSEFLR